MQPERSDPAIRALFEMGVFAPSRRALLSVLAGSLLATFGGDIEAKKRKKRKNNKEEGRQGRPDSSAPASSGDLLRWQQEWQRERRRLRGTELPAL